MLIVVMYLKSQWENEFFVSTVNSMSTKAFSANPNPNLHFGDFIRSIDQRKQLSEVIVVIPLTACSATARIREVLEAERKVNNTQVKIAIVNRNNKRIIWMYCTTTKTIIYFGKLNTSGALI